MISLEELQKKFSSFTKLKIYLIWGISIATVAFFAYSMYLKNESTILQFKLMQLEASNQSLVKQQSVRILRRSPVQANTNRNGRNNW